MSVSLPLIATGVAAGLALALAALAAWAVSVRRAPPRLRLPGPRSALVVVADATRGDWIVHVPVENRSAEPLRGVTLEALVKDRRVRVTLARERVAGLAPHARAVFEVRVQGPPGTHTLRLKVRARNAATTQAAVEVELRSTSKHRLMTA